MVKRKVEVFVEPAPKMTKEEWALEMLNLCALAEQYGKGYHVEFADDHQLDVSIDFNSNYGDWKASNAEHFFYGDDEWRIGSTKDQFEVIEVAINAAIRKERLKQDALSKLSPEERSALGF